MRRIIKPIKNKTVFRVTPSKALLLWALLSSCAFGFTSIAIVGNKQRIIVASDTLANTTIGKNLKARKSHECKIGIHEGLVVMRAGLVEDVHRGFFPERAAFKIFSQGGSMTTRANRFAAAMKTPLLNSLTILQRNNPSTYKDIFGTYGLQVAVIYVENSIPILAIISFRKSDSAAGIPVRITPEIVICPGPSCTEYYGWPLGANKAVNRAAADPHFVTGDPVVDAKKMVQLEILDEPETVGPPIEVLEIPANGPRCLERHVCK
jgi:hypothetical protein